MEKKSSLEDESFLKGFVRKDFKEKSYEVRILIDSRNLSDEDGTSSKEKTKEYLDFVVKQTGQFIVPAFCKVDFPETWNSLRYRIDELKLYSKFHDEKENVDWVPASVRFSFLGKDGENVFNGEIYQESLSNPKLLKYDNMITIQECRIGNGLSCSDEKTNI